MSSPFFRNSRLRLVCTRLNSQWRSSKTPFHSLPEKSSHSSSFPLISATENHQYNYKLLMNHRFLCTTTTNPSSVFNRQFQTQMPRRGVDSRMVILEIVKASRSQREKPVSGGPASWKNILLGAGFAAGLGYYNHNHNEEQRQLEEICEALKALLEAFSVGMATIKGFNLIDHNGKSVTEKDFLGKWNLIYFGDTHSPDLCPHELPKLALAIDKIKEKSGIEVVPIFLSVNPERDTVERVREYVKEFHPNLVGLTGAEDEIKKAARVTYLMDPNMQYVKLFGRIVDDASFADGVIQEMEPFALSAMRILEYINLIFSSVSLEDITFNGLTMLGKKEIKGGELVSTI